MPALRIKPLDRRHLGAGYRADRGDTGSSGASLHVHGAGATQAIPQPNLVPVRPKSSRITQSNGASSGLRTETVRPLRSNVVMIA